VACSSKLALAMHGVGQHSIARKRGHRQRSLNDYGLLRRVVIGLVALGAVWVTGCHKQSTSAPSVAFTHIPPAAQGGRERVDTIAGTVSGGQAGQQIVVYARSGPWWVQPWPDKPFIPIKPDSTWSTPTHLGFEYAALLVEPGYHPPPTLDTAPEVGGHILAVTSVHGTGTVQLAPTKPLKFSGYDWHVRTIASDRGGLNNLYDADNASTDSSGALHLTMKKRDGRWSCAEVVMNQSLGYGTYITVVRDTSHLEPAAVLSMTTFDDWGGDEHFREMDIEMSRWGDPLAKSNAQFAIQPFYIPGDLTKFAAPAGTLTDVLRWEPGKASFKTVRGSADSPGAPVVAEHVFTSHVPAPGKETFQFLFYVVASEHNPLEHENEAIIEKFTYLP
jgi:hypothetical protein